MNVMQDFALEIQKKEEELAAHAEDPEVKAEAERRKMHTPMWAMKMEHNYEK